MKIIASREALIQHYETLNVTLPMFATAHAAEELALQRIYLANDQAALAALEAQITPP